MQITTTFRHMEQSEALKSYAAEKLERVKKYIDEPVTAQVFFTVEKIRHAAEVTLTAKGIIIKAAEETNDMYAALDAVVDKIERQLRRYKERLKDHKPTADTRAIEVQKSIVTAESIEQQAAPVIIPSKTISIKPMSVEEAVMQMDLLHKDFLVFTDAATEVINVVYRRKDGNYGLIEPAHDPCRRRASRLRAEDNQPLNAISLSIEDLLSDKEYGLELILFAGREGINHRIHSSRIQKPGLALTGYTEHLHPSRVQVLGNTEISYLRQVAEPLAIANIEKLCQFPICCFIVTKGLDPPDFLKAAADRAGIPLLVTPHQSSTFISLITKFLEERLLPTTHIHGVLVDVLGVGVLLLGKSGIGKSECALDLVIRGHRLVADDVVYVKKKVPAALVGRAAEAIQYHIEIRGLGIINIKNLFGVSSIREKKIIDMVIELVEWDPNHEYDRLGLDDEVYSILDVEVPHVRIPVRPGRNLTSIIEVAARNHLLKGMGYHSARELHEKLMARMEVRPLGDEVE